MGVGLDFAGKVKVNVGVLVPFKAQEGFKGYVVAVAVQLFPALGAVTVGKVKAASDTAVGEKLGVFAFGTPVVGGQGVYFGNVR